MLYKKKTQKLINAEQFNASPKQVFKYNIFPEPNAKGSTYFDYFIETEDGDQQILKGDYIITIDNNKYKIVRQDTFEQTYEPVD